MIYIITAGVAVWLIVGAGLAFALCSGIAYADTHDGEGNLMEKGE